MTSIPGGLFQQQTSLQFLDLSDNSISGIHPDMWEGLKQLVELRLSGNNIQSMEHGAFAHMTSLTRIQVDINIVQRFPEELSDRQTYPDSPRVPTLVCGGSLDVECTRELCWLKTLESRNVRVVTPKGAPFTPRCTNNPGVLWNNVNLACKCELVCSGSERVASQIFLDRLVEFRSISLHFAMFSRCAGATA